MKTRFCPSPTGFMHLGNARTALFSALYAWHHDGIFLLRIEDTDTQRSTESYTQAVKENLIWLGLPWQEGPYQQSHRQAIYDGLYQQLIDQKQAYPCFCTQEELKASRDALLRSGQQPRYTGTCRFLTEEAIQKKEHAGYRPTLRFKVPEDQSIDFDDLIRGPQHFSSRDLGDFIIRRADHSPAFLFCNAVDDALMGVTHVLRGEDHLTNTPRQCMILNACGLKQPRYGHLSLILGHDQTPLSKRHGSFHLNDLKAQGYLPEAIVNYMARLGHHLPHDDQELMRMDQLTDNFHVAHLGRAPAQFDPSQLLFWQKKAFALLESQTIWEALDQDTKAMVPHECSLHFIDLIKPNIRFFGEVTPWAHALFAPSLKHQGEALALLKTAGPLFFDTAIHTHTTLCDAGFKAWCRVIQSTLAIKGKACFMPLRIALTGETTGPNLADICHFKSHDPAWVVQRLKHAKEQL